MERFSRVIQHYNSFISVFFQNDIEEMLLKIISDSLCHVFYGRFRYEIQIYLVLIDMKLKNSPAFYDIQESKSGEELIDDLNISFPS